MGCELALNLANKGAQIELILGPSAQNPIHSNINITRVESAEDMYQSSMQHFNSSDIVICAAAVSDYRPQSTADHKIKKTQGTPSINLVETRDILATMGLSKENQFLVGFALETHNEVLNAKSKLKQKNLDLIILNSLQDKGAGFQYDTNKITILTKSNKMLSFELKSKLEVAKDIVNTILSEIDA